MLQAALHSVCPLTTPSRCRVSNTPVVPVVLPTATLVARRSTIEAHAAAKGPTNSSQPLQASTGPTAIAEQPRTAFSSRVSNAAEHNRMAGRAAGRTQVAAAPQGDTPQPSKPSLLGRQSTASTTVQSKSYPDTPSAGLSSSSGAAMAPKLLETVVEADEEGFESAYAMPAQVLYDGRSQLAGAAAADAYGLTFSAQPSAALHGATSPIDVRQQQPTNDRPSNAVFLAASASDIPSDSAGAAGMESGLRSSQHQDADSLQQAALHSQPPSATSTAPNYSSSMQSARHHHRTHPSAAPLNEVDAFGTAGHPQGLLAAQGSPHRTAPAASRHAPAVSRQPEAAAAPAGGASAVAAAAADDTVDHRSGNEAMQELQATLVQSLTSTVEAAMAQMR